jgi:L-threonylcarbamoyladenylate synthase
VGASRRSTAAISFTAKKDSKIPTSSPKGPTVSPADERAIAEGGRLIGAGRLVAFPTETVYGLGADATDDRAVAAIFEAKGRPTLNPLIIHVLDQQAAERMVRFDERARTLAGRFWPGPLTLVLPRQVDCPVSLLAGAGLDTLAVRVPNHPIARALLKATGRPLAAPSANRSGAISPTHAEHVAASLGAAIDLIIDGGPCLLGIESTIVDLSGDLPILLRPGGIAVEDIETLIGTLASPDQNAAPRAPGMLARHYAPSRPLRLDAVKAGSGEVLLGFGPAAPGGALNLSPTGNLREAAANLFAMLHQLDRSEIGAIAVMAIPEQGLGRAINDRLRRAASPNLDD